MAIAKAHMTGLAKIDEACWKASKHKVVLLAGTALFPDRQFPSRRSRKSRQKVSSGSRKGVRRNARASTTGQAFHTVTMVSTPPGDAIHLLHRSNPCFTWLCGHYLLMRSLPLIAVVTVRGEKVIPFVNRSTPSSFKSMEDHSSPAFVLQAV